MYQKELLIIFQKVDDFLKKGIALDNISDISWWYKGVKIRNIVVYEDYSPPSYLKLMIDKDIEVIKFSDLFKKIIEYSINKKGVKEQNATMRFLYFLINEKLVGRY